MSSLLALIIFYCLLFLEPSTPQQLTYRNLDAGFTLASDSLEYLISKIPSPAENPTFKEIYKRINDFISEKVEGNRASLISTGDQGVKEGIRITLEVAKIPASMDTFLKSSKDRTPEAFNKLLDEIGKIWEGEIQPLVVKAGVPVAIGQAVKGEEEQPQ